MNELTISDFQRIVVRKLEELNENVIVNNPDTKQEFPLGVVNNPMEAIDMTNEENIPIYKTFQISVNWWTDSKYLSMDKYINCNNKLKELNILQKSSSIDTYDEVTKKYVYGATYEVNYNGITNSFEKIK